MTPYRNLLLKEITISGPQPTKPDKPLSPSLHTYKSFPAHRNVFGGAKKPGPATGVFFLRDNSQIRKRSNTPDDDVYLPRYPFSL